MSRIVEIIAQSIQKADKSYFNEDYAKQAKAVIDGLRREGYAVVPLQPPEVLVEFAVENIPFGRLRPSDLIRSLYAIMVENARRFMP